MIFKHICNVKETKRIAKFDGLEPRRCKDIKLIVVPEMGPKSFGLLLGRQTPALSFFSASERELKTRSFSPSIIFNFCQPYFKPKRSACRC